MNLRAPAILLAARPHGESAVIARLLTQNHGMIAAYIAGGRGRQLRPVMIPGNALEAEIRAKSDHQLPFARVELVTSRAPWMTEPLPAAAIAWACLSEVDEIAVAPGRLVGTRPNLVVQPLETSVVRSIEVSVGDVVKASGKVTKVHAKKPICNMDITITATGVRTEGEPAETIVVMTGDVAVFRAMPHAAVSASARRCAARASGGRGSAATHSSAGIRW